MSIIRPDVLKIVPSLQPYFKQVSQASLNPSHQNASCVSSPPSDLPPEPTAATPQSQTEAGPTQGPQLPESAASNDVTFPEASKPEHSKFPLQTSPDYYLKYYFQLQPDTDTHMPLHTFAHAQVFLTNS